MLVFFILYFKSTVMVLLSVCCNISKLSTFMLGKYLFNLKDIISSKPSKLLLVICSKIKSLNPPPKLGFKGLSPGLVKKKLIKLFLIESLVV